MAFASAIGAPGSRTGVAVGDARAATSRSGTYVVSFEKKILGAYPLTGKEALKRITSDSRVGKASLRVRLAAAPRAQGIFVPFRAVGRTRAFKCFLWFRGVRGKHYALSVTQEDGVVRAASRPWKATGKWERRGLAVRLRAGDKGLNVIVGRTRRVGREAFKVDDFRIQPAT